MQVLISRAGSAGGPEPGRAGFYLELGRTEHSITADRDFVAADSPMSKSRQLEVDLSLMTIVLGFDGR